MTARGKLIKLLRVHETRGASVSALLQLDALLYIQPASLVPVRSSRLSPMLLYYPNPNPSPMLERPDDKRWQLLPPLKQSVSKTLTHFYPLAGRIKGHPSIDCNDKGAYYVEARTDSHLNHFLNRPYLSLISKFLPSPRTWDAPTPGAMIQVAVFARGGLAIAATVSHMLLDGASLSVFLKAWETMARRDHHHQPQPESKYNNSDPIIEEFDTGREKSVVKVII